MRKFPLTTIKGILQLIKKYDDADFRDYIDLVISEVQSIDLKTNELLTLANSELGKQKKADIVYLVLEVVELLESFAFTRDVKMDCNLSRDEAIYVWCIPDQIKQVFVNLIKNGIESMGKNGKLEVTLTRSAQNKVSIMFSDEGEGISRIQSLKI